MYTEYFFICSLDVDNVSENVSPSVARESATSKQHEQQENFLPSVQRAKHERGPRGPLN